MWLGDSQYRLAGSLLTLIGQLEAAFPDQEWQTSPGTGTIGDAAHRAEGSASDHNPWLNNTVRALDVAKTANGPDCEALFRMVNAMYGAKDPRVFPYGYAIFNGRITDWDNPGGFHAQVGDQHLTHCHISVGQSGYDATNPWPITATPLNLLEQIMALDPSSADYKRLVADIATAGAESVWKKQLSYTNAAGQKLTSAAASYLIMADVNAGKAMHALTDPLGAVSKLSAKVAAIAPDPVKFATDVRAAFSKLIGG